MSDEFLADRRKALEESFFRKRNEELLQKLRKQINLEARRNELAMVSGIRDPKILDRLIRLDFRPETAAALALVPMVRIAWADGELDDSERAAITRAAIEAGLEEANPSYHWLLTWLESPPDTELIVAWTAYVNALCETLSQEDRDALRQELINRAKDVAKAAGGFLGLTDPISKEEEAVLEEMKAAFSV